MAALQTALQYCSNETLTRVEATLFLGAAADVNPSADSAFLSARTSCLLIGATVACKIHIDNVDNDIAEFQGELLHRTFHIHARDEASCSTRLSTTSSADVVIIARPASNCAAPTSSLQTSKRWTQWRRSASGAQHATALPGPQC